MTFHIGKSKETMRKLELDRLVKKLDTPKPGFQKKGKTGWYYDARQSRGAV